VTEEKTYFTKQKSLAIITSLKTGASNHYLANLIKSSNCNASCKMHAICHMLPAQVTANHFQTKR